MKEQLIEMGFKQYGVNIFWYELDVCVIKVDVESCNVYVSDQMFDSVKIATNATIEQISNILKSIQI
jgi:hypothetical protein